MDYILKESTLQRNRCIISGWVFPYITNPKKVVGFRVIFQSGKGFRRWKFEKHCLSTLAQTKGTDHGRWNWVIQKSRSECYYDICNKLLHVMYRPSTVSVNVFFIFIINCKVGHTQRTQAIWKWFHVISFIQPIF